MIDSSAVSAGSRETPFPTNWRSRAAWIALAAYVVYATAQMNLSVERVAVGLHNASHFFGRMFPPNFGR
jgi:phosphonate transport system permease protein